MIPLLFQLNIGSRSLIRPEKIITVLKFQVKNNLLLTIALLASTKNIQAGIILKSAYAEGCNRCMPLHFYIKTFGIYIKRRNQLFHKFFVIRFLHLPRDENKSLVKKRQQLLPVNILLKTIKLVFHHQPRRIVANQIPSLVLPIQFFPIVF